MKSGCIYARVSTDTQELTQQIEACRKYAEIKQIEVKEVYTDVGSGKDFFRRPNYLKMLNDLRFFKYQSLIVFRFDRLGRNTREALMLFEEMDRNGIEIISINEAIDTSTAIGRAMRTFIFALCELERENIAEATKQRLQALKSLGKHIGRPKGAKDSKPRNTDGYRNNKNRAKGNSNNRGVENPMVVTEVQNEIK